VIDANERKWLGLEEAICKMRSLPGERLGLQDPGTIRAGVKADLVLFDPEKVLDQSTTAQPMLEPIGILYVLVNGAVVVDGGKVTGERPGAILRHGAAAVTGQ